MAGGLDPRLTEGWLPPLPSGWVAERLAGRAWIRARLGWRGLTADEYVDDGVPMLSTPDIKGDRLSFEGVNRISRDRYEESPEIQLRVGDVLLTKDGATIGIVNVVRELPEPTTVNGSIAVITPNSTVEPRYLRYCLASRYAQQLMNLLQGGMGVPHLFQADIKRIVLPVPPLSTQEGIADFLDRETAKIDALIDKQLALVDLLDARTSAAVTMAISPSQRSSTTRQQLRRVARLVTGTTPSGSADFFGDQFPHPWFTPEDLGSEMQPRRFLSDAGWHQMRVLPANSVLVCSIGATLAKVGHPRIVCATNQQITGLLPKPGVDDRYLYYALRSARETIIAYSAGNTLPIINTTRLGAVEIPVPELSTQIEIARDLDELTSGHSAISAKALRLLAISQERRAALITAAVTGQLDLSIGKVA